MAPPAPRPRARELGLTFGPLPTGPHNAITDVPGVRVGQVTVWRDEADGSVARTGCTVVAPDTAAGMWQRPMPAGTAVLNGAGELTGSIEVKEWGILESPVVLVSTNNIGRGYDALVDAAIAEGVTDVVVPVVGECDDSWLDDILRRWLTLDHVRQALDTAADGPRRRRRRGRGHRDDHHGPQGRHRHRVARHRRAGHRRRAAAVQLRGRAPAPDRWCAGGRDPRRRA